MRIHTNIQELLPVGTARRRPMPLTRLVLCSLLFAALHSGAMHCQTPTDSVKFEYFPFALYDTDVGFGVGVKLVLRNALESKESFDLLLFASTKGERLFRINFSSPDEELRQGSVYDLAVDLQFEYDKMIQTSFFGTGSGSSHADKEQYVHEPVMVKAALSRGITQTVVTQLQLKLKRMWSYDFESDSRLRDRSDNATTSDLSSLALLLRHDTRNSTLHTTSGHVLQGEIEQAIAITAHGSAWTRLGATAQWYGEYGGIVLAARTILQQTIGGEIPVQHMLSVGGNRTVRGLTENRYLDLSSGVCNVEFRIPVYWRFSAMLGVDAGAVGERLADLPSSRWAVTPVLGGRLAFDTFIARADLGWSPEGIGVYFNFGQAF